MSYIQWSALHPEQKAAFENENKTVCALFERAIEFAREHDIEVAVWYDEMYEPAPITDILDIDFSYNVENN